jgi:hypothetical protein
VKGGSTSVGEELICAKWKTWDSSDILVHSTSWLMLLTPNRLNRMYSLAKSWGSKVSTNASKATAWLQMSTHIIPMRLSGLWIGKCAPFRYRSRMSRKLNIRSELDDALGRLVDGLVVEKHIPDAWRGVLRVECMVGLEKALLAGGMGPEESDKSVCFDGLVLEQPNEVVGSGVDLGKQSLGREDVAVGPSYKRPNAWAKRTDHGRHRCAHLDQVGGSNTVGLVFVVPANPKLGHF